jgi:RimJ/RimL family protein N-acetyltransferase
MLNFKQDILLEGNGVLLRPLSNDDYQSFKQIAFDSDIWKFTVTLIQNEVDLKEYINNGIKLRENKNRYSFVILDRKSNSIAGCTAFGNISEEDRRLEIGWTWLGKGYRHTGLNKEVKFLMLQYAFEILCCERVEFKTDVLNLQSRKALMKIGAIEEGTLRSHTQMHNNRRRDTIYYSILLSEWGNIKSKIYCEFLNQ